ncbi:MAG: GIY-YIG nuclease family protein [Syntrophothermus sp.]|uniref:GIY-YIG nuclease family protein n=1 Tax=Syntrophothermus sp. TaxID=2736299 RepID=UPI00257F64E7|nr:GIY-YIG nuclease family protein [Syntrophothermus sp.]NSW84046.1 GIY-YIG nuclease family protein [Syntrophothermus sp.]
MTVGNWSNYYTYTSSNVDTYVESKAGNYRLATLGNDNKYHVFYVGQSENINRRLKEHLSPSEPNQCIKNKLKNNTCYFRFIYASTQKERDDIESNDINTFDPPCNKQS